MPAPHRNLTLKARNLIKRYRGLQYQYEKRGEAGIFYLADLDTDTLNAIRGQRLDHYLTQILPVNEIRTGRLGQLIPLEQTLATAEAIMNGKYDTTDKETLKFMSQ